MPPWREPAEESLDLYPGLVVWDDRVTGSITTGQSRLPLWAIFPTAVYGGWEEVEKGWSPSDYGFTQQDLVDFVYFLLEQRGEFARLLLILADVERVERKRGWNDRRAWWETRKHRRRVMAQLKRCLEALEADE